MGEYQIRLRGFREFSRELKRVDKKFGKELRQAHLKISKLVVGRTHKAMTSSFGPGRGGVAKARRGVRPKATQSYAAVNTVNNPPWTLGVIWGMRQRSGWFAAPRYADAENRQFEPWVGNQWDPGEHGGKPYYLGDAVNDSIDEAIDIFGEAIEDLARKAGF